MSVLDRYVLVEWSKVFCMVLGSLLALLILQDASNNVSDLSSGSAGFSQIIVYYAHLMVAYLPWLLPVALFLSTLFALARLRRNQELTALKSGGIPLLRLVRVLLCAALLLSGITYYLNATWSSHSMQMAQMMLGEFAGKKQGVGMIDNFEMDCREANRRWFFRKFSSQKNSGEDVHLYARYDSGSEFFRIRSERAFRQEDGSWLFLEGRFLGFEGSEGVPFPDPSGVGIAVDEEFSTASTGEENLVPVPIINKSFHRLTLPEVRDEPKLHELLRKKPSRLSLEELRLVKKSSVDSNHAKIRPYVLREAHLAWTAPGCLLAVILGIPFALLGNGRSVAAGLARALGVFALYYLVRTGSDSLGEAGLLSVQWAAGLPVVFLGCLSLWLLWKVR